uniref:ABC transmembrane type-1 domain-containing protein n=1 Tax=Romanomermis culicivorax TaxID=13658 RepID=A0A915IMN4_ROMCU
LAILGWRRPLVFEDLWSLNDNDTSESLIPLWKSKWDPSYAIYKQQSLQSRQPAIVLTYKENNSHSENTVQETLLLKTKPNFVAEPSIILPLFKCLKWKIIPSVLQRIMSDMLQFASPLLLNALITFVQDPKQNQWKGYFYALCMFLVAMLGTFLQNYGFATLSRACMNFRSMLTMAVYEKALKLSTSSKHQKSLGETVNIMSTDIQLMQDVGMHLIIVMSSPFQVIVAIYLLYQQIGFSIFIGSIVMFLLIPINFWLSSKQRKYQIMQMRYKDERIKITNEILNGMKVIKLYAWEQCFEKRIQTIRDKEISIIKKAGYYGAVVTFTWNCAPFLISVASFASFVFLADGQLTPQTAFVSISLFNILRFPMTLLPMIVSFLIKASVSNKRIKSFLVADEINENSVLRKEEKIGSVKIENASFDWKYESGTPASEKSTLSGVNINVEPGQLIAVVGSVGCGKSSMLSAILGEMNKSEGSLVV